MGRRLDEEARRHQSGTVVGARWKRDEEEGKLSRDRPIREEDEKVGEKAIKQGEGSGGDRVGRPIRGQAE
jgi:hypothetical protein